MAYIIDNYELSTAEEPLIIVQPKLLFDKIPFPKPTNPQFKFIDLFAGIVINNLILIVKKLLNNEK